MDTACGGDQQWVEELCLPFRNAIGGYYADAIHPQTLRDAAEWVAAATIPSNCRLPLCCSSSYLSFSVAGQLRCTVGTAIFRGGTSGSSITRWVLAEMAAIHLSPWLAESEEVPVIMV